MDPLLLLPSNLGTANSCPSVGNTLGLPKGLLRRFVIRERHVVDVAVGVAALATDVTKVAGRY